MNEYTEKLKYVLVDGKYVDASDFKKAEKDSEILGIDLADYLIENGYISNDLFGQAVAEIYNVAYADLNTKKPPKNQIFKIPFDVADKYRVVLFDEGEKDVTVTTDVPNQKDLAESLRIFFPKKKIHIAFSLGEDIDETLLAYQKPLDDRIKKFLEDEDSTSQIIDEIFKEAMVNKSSDIHIEPRLSDVHVRLRIDGILQNRAVIPKENFDSLLNRIKVLSRLRIDEHGSTQDGSLRYKDGSRFIDMRVSIAPTIYGEKIVIRVLTSYIKGLTLDKLGLSNSDQQVLEESAKKPFGMIINTGPTGSGKTTTLYSIMRMLNKPEVNITTIEDPVEYRIAGLNQIQVNLAKNVTFANGLRSVVRQDPDIILVGEIRDNETAEIATNAALTGHLLLSTFHANDAATAIPRLLDMGIEPFLLASTLELIIAQRLVRKICENCRYSEDVDVKEVEKEMKGYKISRAKTITLYKGKGCNACNDTGYSGRQAIFEYVEATSEMKDLILTNPSSRDIWELAKKQGSKTLFEDGLEKVKRGDTTVEELMRVAKPPENDKKPRAKKKK